MRNILYLIPISCLLLFSSCGWHENNRDTPTSGHICMAADREYMPITEAERTVFTALYADAHIRPFYVTEDSAFALLMSDSVRLIVASRKLNPKEEAYFHNKNIFPQQVKIAGDALVFIVNRSNADTLLSVQELKAVFTGKDSLWAQVGHASVPNKIAAVFDYQNSAGSLYIERNLMYHTKYPSYCFAMHGSRQVINYVAANKNALGIIDVNWISNDYDTTVIRELKSVKVVAVGTKNSSVSGNYFKPWPEYVQTGQYPLCRNIYIISRETYTGLGSGFLAFVTSDRGQRIVYREGLLPAIMPSQNIRF